MTTVSESRKNSTRVAMLRGDLEQRGHKLPPRTPGKHAAPHPTMQAGGETWPTFVVIRGEDMLAGKLSISKLVLAVDAETACQVLDYVSAREEGLAAPDFASEAAS